MNVWILHTHTHTSTYDMHEILDSDIVLNALNFIEVGEKWSN